MECIICYESTDSIILNCCKNTVCIDCYRKLSSCPFCRKRIRYYEHILDIQEHTPINFSVRIYEDSRCNRTSSITLCIFFFIVTLCIMLIQNVFKIDSDNND